MNFLIILHENKTADFYISPSGFSANLEKSSTVIFIFCSFEYYHILCIALFKNSKQYVNLSTNYNNFKLSIVYSVKYKYANYMQDGEFRSKYSFLVIKTWT